MSNGGLDPIEFARRLSESFREVRFGSGIVGKTAYATLAVIGLWAVVIFRLSADWKLNLALIVAALVGTGIYVWWVRKTQAFAEKNPSLALLEGAQLLEYQKFEAQAKGLVRTNTVVIPGPERNGDGK